MPLFPQFCLQLQIKRHLRDLPGPVLPCALVLWSLLPPPFSPATLQDHRWNALDLVRVEAGYYESLQNSARSLADPAPPDMGIPPGIAPGLFDPVADVRERVLKPNLTGKIAQIPFHTNPLGMRDDLPVMPKPPQIWRIALVGDSVAAGWGVAEGAGYDRLLEHLPLNLPAPRTTLEVVNTAVPGHAPGQRWEHVHRLAWQFQPDLILVQATPADVGWDERRLRSLANRGLGYDSAGYGPALKSLGLHPTSPSEHVRAALWQQRDRLLLGVYSTITADCRARRIPSAFFLLPRVGRPTDPSISRLLLDLARQAGFDFIADLSQLFDGIPAQDLAVAPGDYHPNAWGHRLIARELAPWLTSRILPACADSPSEPLARIATPGGSIQ